VKRALADTEYTVQGYKDAVQAYRNTRSKREKAGLERVIADIKARFRQEAELSDPLARRKQRLEAELSALTKQGALFEPTRKEAQETEARVAELSAQLAATEADMEAVRSGKIYENAFEWRFEFPEALSDEGDFIGFDIVIGNPPYVSAPTMVEIHPELRNAISNSKRYSTLYQKWDLYIPFVEFGMQLLSANGLMAMIIPYPFTNQTYGKKLRELVVKQYNLIELADLNGTKVFEKATVSNCIPIISKSPPSGSCFISHINEKKQIIRAFSQPYSDLVQDANTAVWNLTSEQRNSNRHSDMSILGDFCYISKGMVLNADEKTAKREFAKDDLISETCDDVHCREYIEAKDIERYRVKKVRYLEYNTKRCPEKLSRPTFRELYEKPKLMFNRLGTLQVILDGKTKYLHSDSMFSAVLWKDLKRVDNKSISASVTRYSRYSRKEMEVFSEQIDLRYLLGVLNSKYASVLLSNLRGGDYHIYPEHLRNLPVPNVSLEQQQPIIALADKILAAKAADPKADTGALEAQIDEAVYALYDLGKEEIKVVEGGGK
jgi:adenine-specific DNA-methyltransferase